MVKLFVFKSGVQRRFRCLQGIEKTARKECRLGIYSAEVVKTWPQLASSILRQAGRFGIKPAVERNYRVTGNEALT